MMLLVQPDIHTINILMIKTVIFGFGEYYRKYSETLFYTSEVVAICVSDSSKYESEINGVPIIEPRNLKDIFYDKIVILVKEQDDIRNYLVSNGAVLQDIEDIFEYRKKHLDGIRRCIVKTYDRKKGTVLVISDNLELSGAPISAVYLSIALYEEGYEVVLAAPVIDDRLVSEFSGKEIGLEQVFSLPYIRNEDLKWVCTFDHVIVNSYTMIQSVYDISETRKVIWWLHESGERHDKVYSEMSKRFNVTFNEERITNIRALAVSSIAKRAFLMHHGSKNWNVGELLLGMPDTYQSIENKNNEKIIFALIGGIIELKGHDILLDAIDLLSDDEKERCEFWFIGKKFNTEYCRGITERILAYSNVVIKGEFSREEMSEAYTYIDCVICASREETLSITVVEGLMHGKICIVSDATGVAEYINNGRNGFVFKNQDAGMLSIHIKNFISDKFRTDYIRANARETYNSFFSMKAFEKRVRELV
ncbi:MAG: glycosyltransferase family 4 protein [Lachnospiraceae bacterium]|nr:glycosyltransferase family 4 protein [Lachnospiraceae bacterium]